MNHHLPRFERIKKGKGKLWSLCPLCLSFLTRSHSALLPAGSVLETVFFLETLNPPRGVDKLLLAREEGVALRTDIHVNIWHCRTRLNDVATGTGDRGWLVFRMNAFFHNKSYPNTVIGV